MSTARKQKEVGPGGIIVSVALAAVVVIGVLNYNDENRIRREEEARATALTWAASADQSHTVIRTEWAAWGHNPVINVDIEHSATATRLIRLRVRPGHPDYATVRYRCPRRVTLVYLDEVAWAQAPRDEPESHLGIVGVQ